MDEIKVSIIVPIYNVEQYLDRCIESLVNQSLREIEIILVNDGSKDESGKICDRWSTKDTRIKYVHKKNGGVASARNAGLAVAEGKYIGFVDPDDYIDLNMYKILYEASQENDADIVSCGVNEVRENIGTRQISNAFSGEMESKEAIRHLLIWDGYVPSFLWNKIYNRRLADSVSFHEELLVGEDTPFIYECLKKSNRFYQVKESLYFYMRRDDSLISNDYKHKKMCSVKAAEMIRSDCMSCLPELSNEAQCHVAFDCYLIICKLVEQGGMEKYKEDYDYLKKAMRAVSNNCVKVCLPKKKYIQYILCRSNPVLFMRMKKFFGNV